MVYDLLCKLKVALGTARSRVINDNRLSKARSFGQPDVSWNDCLENLRAIKVPEVLGYGGRKVGPFIKHCKKQAFDREIWIQLSAEARKSVEKLSNAFESIIFTLNRDQKGIGRSEAIHGQDSKTWRAIYQNVVKILTNRFEKLLESIAAVLSIDKLDLGSCDVFV
jgi:hypothetical protein